MKKTIKLVSIVIAFILLLLIVGPLIGALIFDPNDYKDEISELVEDQTGRTLTINGDLSYSVFPWLGLSLGELSLSNSTATGFSKAPFAKIESADVKIKIMPLFSGKVEVDKIVLAGLNLSLEKNKLGASNWDDLIAKSKKSKTTTAKPKKPASNKTDKPTTEKDLILPAIAGIELTNANINWHDKQLGQQYQLQDLYFTTGVIADKTPTDINVSFSFKLNEPKVSGKTALSARLEFNIKNKSININDIKLEQELTQKIQQPNNLQLTLTSDYIKADLTKQTAKISNLKIKVLDLEIKTSLTAKNLLSDISVSGNLASNKINPTNLLKTLKIELPPMADKKTLHTAKLDFTFNATTKKITIPKLSLLFDESKLSGKVSLTDFSKPKLRYQLNLDKINVDRYLPPPASPHKTAGAKNINITKQSAKTTVVKEQPLPIPVVLLLGLDIKGGLTINKTVVSKLRSQDIVLNVLAKNGIIRVHPLTAKMYKGKYSGDITLDVQKKLPVVTINETISNVAFKPLVIDFLGEDYISGYGTATAKLKTHGLNVSDFTKNLNGRVFFNITDSKIKYLKPANFLENEINQFTSKYTNKPFKKKLGQDNPDVFKVMKGSFNIIKGIAHNDDFITESRDVNLTGKGYVDLIKQNVNYKLKIYLQKPKTGDKGFDDYLKRNPISNPIHGPFTNLSYNNFDIGHLIRKFFEERIKKQVDSEKQKIEQKAKKDAQKKIDFEAKKLEEKLKKELDKLFK